ncbi:MAG TPA: beta-N-acetylhexosaminidase [Bacteriovoracaceae bacterium]|nr:beta-N-acetylhexosaminidase [Bacteriovoracaceae bacterium]
MKSSDISTDNYGQLIVSGIKGITLLPEEAEFIKNEKLGGIIFFAQNFEDPAQLAELVNSIQKLRDEYPLFISVDQEGGRVIRFKKHFTQLPSMLSLAKMDSPKLIFEAHEIVAKELAACGINLSYSPCCDILTNPENKVIGDRAYGTDAVTVEKYISAAIRGLQTHGVLACAKHFPGHGGTTKDSHFDLPLVKTSLAELRQRELIPFIKASKSRVEFMMMAHLIVDALDEKMPTTLSPKAYEFLRNETKFSKIVITDDMEMKAIADRFTIEESAVLALNAGTDMLLYRFMEDAVKALGSIREATKKRLIKKEALTEKLQRVERCKKEFLSNYQPIYIPKITEVFNSIESKKFLEQYQASQTKTV